MAVANLCKIAHFAPNRAMPPTALVGERADVRKWPTPDGTLLDHSVIIQPTKNGAPVGPR
jgi:hypothetical protein